MKSIELYKKENCYLYLEKDIDTDGSWYLKQKNEVKDNKPIFIQNIEKEYEKQINKIINKRKLSWYYVIGYKLYFTYNNIKYYIYLPHMSTSVNEFYVRKLVYSLRKLKCSKFYFKEGHTD